MSANISMKGHVLLAVFWCPYFLHIQRPICAVENGLKKRHLNQLFSQWDSQGPPRTWDPLVPILFPNPTSFFESLKIWE